MEKTVTLKTLFRLALAGLALGLLPSCSFGYIDRAIFTETVRAEPRDDLSVHLESDTSGIHWHRDGGRASLYISAKSKEPPILKAVSWRIGEKWQEVKKLKVGTPLSARPNEWYSHTDLGFLFKSTEPTDLELRVHLEHRGRSQVVVQRYRVVRDQEWHTFNILLDIT